MSFSDINLFTAPLLDYEGALEIINSHFKNGDWPPPSELIYMIDWKSVSELQKKELFGYFDEELFANHPATELVQEGCSYTPNPALNHENLQTLQTRSTYDVDDDALTFIIE
jgi:hypothetical protein